VAQRATGQPLDSTDLRVMVAVADRIAAALIIGRERQRLSERADLFRHLHEFSEAINGTLQPDELFRAIVRSVSIVVEADIAPPTADAGADRTATLPQTSVGLEGSVADDGLPAGGSLAITWSQVSGLSTWASAPPAPAAARWTPGRCTGGR
jgi:hypothetical protein